MHHPWRQLRDDWPDWDVRIAHLEHGVKGYADPELRIFWLSAKLNQAGRRCTLQHEIQHALAGHATECDVAEDQIVELAAARILLPIDELVSVLRWARSYDEAADELWVDPQMLRCRIRFLGLAERAAIQAAIMNRDNEEERPA